MIVASRPLLNRAGSVVLSMQRTLLPGPLWYRQGTQVGGEAERATLGSALLLDVMMVLCRDALGFHIAGFRPLETGVNSLSSQPL